MTEKEKLERSISVRKKQLAQRQEQIKELKKATPVDEELIDSLTNLVESLNDVQYQDRLSLKALLFPGQKFERKKFIVQKFERKGTISLEEGLKYIPSPQKGKFYGELINLDSSRLKLFSKGQTCVRCGLTAEFFAVEKALNDDITKTYHLNMYGTRDGEDILFTKDHIIPRSRGGSNELTNLQTMCYHCNYKKGNRELF